MCKKEWYEEESYLEWKRDLELEFGPQIVNSDLFAEFATFMYDFGFNDGQES
jgi:hypothetical protein